MWRRGFYLREVTNSSTSNEQRGRISSVGHAGEREWVSVCVFVCVRERERQRERERDWERERQLRAGDGRHSCTIFYVCLRVSLFLSLSLTHIHTRTCTRLPIQTHSNTNTHTHLRTLHLSFMLSSLQLENSETLLLFKPTLIQLTSLPYTHSLQLCVRACECVRLQESVVGKSEMDGKSVCVCGRKGKNNFVFEWCVSVLRIAEGSTTKKFVNQQKIEKFQKIVVTEFFCWYDPSREDEILAHPLSSIVFWINFSTRTRNKTVRPSVVWQLNLTHRLCSFSLRWLSSQSAKKHFKMIRSSWSFFLSYKIL